MIQVQWIKCNCWPVAPIQVMWQYHLWHYHWSQKCVSFTRARMELQPCARCDRVCLAMMHRLICNMAYMGHSSCPGPTWPRPGFLIYLLGVKIYVFQFVLMRGMRRWEPYSSTFLSWKVLCKNINFTKNNIFIWPALGRSKCDLRFSNLVWNDSEHPKLSFHLCCKAVL